MTNRHKGIVLGYLVPLALFVLNQNNSRIYHAGSMYASCRKFIRFPTCSSKLLRKDHKCVITISDVTFQREKQKRSTIVAYSDDYTDGLGQKKTSTNRKYLTNQGGSITSIDLPGHETHTPDRSGSSVAAVSRRPSTI